jgi:glycosyltransferase involved in cell wall biosynthesis
LNPARGGAIIVSIMRTLALIPCYNEASNIAEVVAACREHVEAVLVVDDGSTDGTDAAAREAGAEVITHDPNRGKGIALNTGYDYAVREGYDAVITLDGDGQHDPAEIPKFTAAARAHPEAHIVLGNRMGDASRMPRIRRFTNRLTTFFVNRMSGLHTQDSQTGYRLIRTEVLKRVRCTSRTYDAESEILVHAGRAGFKVIEVPIATIYRPEAASSIHPIREPLRFARFVLRHW